LDGLRGTLSLIALLVVLSASFALAQTASPIPQASKSLVITFPNPHVFLSPYNWRVPGDGTIWAPLGGPYFKFSVTGTTQVIANIDTAGNASLPATDMPTLKVIVDDKPGVFLQFTSGQKQATLASGLSTDSTHTVLVYNIGAGDPVTTTSTQVQTHIQSLQFDAGATLSAYPSIFSKNCLIYGDSYVLGSNGQPYISGTTPLYTVLDPSMSWANQIGYGIGCEVGVVAVGGSGYLQPGGWGYPALSSYWNYYHSGLARNFSPSPDYTINALGINDHRGLGWTASTVQEAVQSWLKAVRSTLPNTKLFLYIPLGGLVEDEDGTGGANATPIREAVSAFGDANTFLIDSGTQFVSADNWVYQTWLTGPDGIHPAQTSHAILATIAMQQIQKALDSSRVAIPVPHRHRSVVARHN
jgi:lysophospholipase L1-like esterase